MNGICDECSGIKQWTACIECTVQLCNNKIHHCSICEFAVCKLHSDNCNKCNKTHCNSVICRKKCSKCQKQFCSSCVDECKHCKKIFCKECSNPDLVKNTNKTICISK